MIIALDDIFTDDKNFFFGNPLEIVYSKIRCKILFILFNFSEFLGVSFA